ncbi:MAG TPA: hypothetical protein VGH79_09005 [Gaiellaceae bacterium]|jgi:hypothetical protein
MTIDRAELNAWLQQVGHRESRTVENLIEHVFLSEVIQECFFRQRRLVEVARAEVDAAGYDLILGLDGVVRHVQLKASRRGGSTRKQTINRKLADRQGGCIVWIEYSVDPTSCRADLSYLWREAAKLPATVARNTRTGAPRVNSCDIKRSEFERLPDVSSLVDRLFPVPRTRKVVK